MNTGICRRGEIYYIERNNTIGAEISKGRPAIVVSNDFYNRHSGVVEVVYLTTQPKKDLPTHVKVYGSGRESTALCEQIDTVSVERIDTYCGKCTQEEMEKINAALQVSLGLAECSDYGSDLTPFTEDTTTAEEDATIALNARAKLAIANAKLAMLQEMYDSLLNKTIKN